MALQELWTIGPTDSWSHGLLVYHRVDDWYHRPDLHVGIPQQSNSVTQKIPDGLK